MRAVLAPALIDIAVESLVAEIDHTDDVITSTAGFDDPQSLHDSLDYV